MRIAIDMEGGLVQSVFADGPGCDCAILDLDIEGVDPHTLRLSPSGEKCTIRISECLNNPEYVGAVFHRGSRSAVPPGLVLDMVAVLAQIVASHDNWRGCSDQREALDAWNETVNRARRVLDHVGGVPGQKDEANHG